MTDEKSRREFMRQSSATAVSFSLSSLLPDAVTEALGGSTTESQQFFGENDGLLFERGAHPAHPYDTQFDDYFNLSYVEGLREPIGSPKDIVDRDSEVKDLVIHMSEAQDLPEGHPVRKMAEITPEPKTPLDYGPGGRSIGGMEAKENELKDVIHDAVMENDGDWDKTWRDMQEDVETAKQTVFEYSDRRKEHDNELEVLVENAFELPNSYRNAYFGTQRYHGNEFDAVFDGEKATLQFHDSELYIKPEDILNEKEFTEVSEGEKSYNELSSDQQVLFQVYNTVLDEKEYILE